MATKNDVRRGPAPPSAMTAEGRQPPPAADEHRRRQAAPVVRRGVYRTKPRSIVNRGRSSLTRPCCAQLGRRALFRHCRNSRAAPRAAASDDLMMPGVVE
jgi:hypothetical protein